MSENETSRQTVIKNIESFLQKNKVLMVVLLSAIVAAIGIIFFYSLWLTDINSKSMEKLNLLQEQYEQWNSALDNATKTEKETAILEQIKTIRRNYPNTYAGMRTLFISGNLFFQKNEWEKAVTEYLKLAKDFKTAYLACLALKYSAIAYDQMNQIDKAIDTYKKILKDYKEDITTDIPYCTFELFRLSEAKGDYTAMNKYLSELTDKYSDNSWTKIARTRIIYLKGIGKIQ